LEPYSPGEHRSAGFTLIELLIVLVLMGLGASLILPDLWGRYEKTRDKDVLLTFAKQIEVYRRVAFQTGKTIAITTKNSKYRHHQLPAMPGGWQVDNKKVMYLFPDGITSGGEFSIHDPSGRAWRVLFSPIYGQVKFHEE